MKNLVDLFVRRIRNPLILDKHGANRVKLRLTFKRPNFFLWFIFGKWLFFFVLVLKGNYAKFAHDLGLKKIMTISTIECRKIFKVKNI